MEQTTVKNAEKPPAKPPAKPSVFQLLGNYRGLIAVLVMCALISNGASLAIPKLISSGITKFVQGQSVGDALIWPFLLVILCVFIFAALQSVIQTIVAERAARDVREQLAAKLSRQSYAYIQNANPGKLLSYLTSDIDSIKLFIAQAIPALVSSLVLIIGASILLISLNYKLALAVLMVIPLIGGTFAVVFGRVKVLFTKSREVIDWLNKVINESILGAAFIRVVYGQQVERKKFTAANAEAQDLGLRILSMFAIMIPIITLITNLAMLVILVLGGHFIIQGTMNLGDFAAFNTYLAMLIFPILMVGFTSSITAQATASYQRIQEVLLASEVEEQGTRMTDINGDIALKNVNVAYGEKMALKDVSFSVRAGTKTAIIGPTAAGKTQLLSLLTGLIKPTSGTVEFDGHPVNEYNLDHLHEQIGFVFQDSVLFNLSLRENIAFNPDVTEASLKKAIETAELKDFIDQLPQGLDTIVSERGTSLSGGQKQRIMLARALAVEPKILLLDDFTARVDGNTEQRILKNIDRLYPGLTIVSVTQKIASVEAYDQVMLLMEGELLASGTHQELLARSPEYVQIYTSQQSTNQYELHAE